MPSRQQTPIVRIPLPLHGLNDRQDPYAIGDAEAATLENIDIGQKVAVSRRGYTSLGTVTTGPIRRLVQFKTSDGLSRLLRMRQATIEKYDENTATWSALSLPITLTNDLVPRCVVLNDLLLVSNGTDSDLTIDGSDVVTEYASNPKAEFQIIFQNRVVKLNAATCKLSWSAINDPTTWGAADYVYIDPNNAAKGTGLAELNGQVIVFKENKKYALTALTSGSTLPLDGSISTVGHDTIASTGSSLIFLGPRGWYELRGTITRLISDHIDITKLDLSRISDACAVFFDGRYRCFVTESGYSYNNLEYVFATTVPTPYETNPYAVMVNRGLNGSCYCLSSSLGQEILYFGDSRPDSGSPSTQYGCVYQMFNGNSDNGAAIAAFWTTKLYDFNKSFFVKKYKKVYLRIVYASGLTVYLAYRFTSTGAWSETTIPITATDLSWVMDDLSEITEWSEGLGFPLEDITDSFTSIANTGKPRTIQFRVRCSSQGDVRGRFVAMALKYRQKEKFK